MCKIKRILIKSKTTALLGIIISLLNLTADICYGQDVRITDKKILFSDILNEDRTIYISSPPEISKKKYPVLYLLDGDTNIQLAAGIRDYLSKYKLIPEIIIAGIGNTERTRDMTPSKSLMFPKSGGAENFYKFITSELMPYIKTNYPASSEKILLGHSLGGLFTIYSLLKNPEMFNSYIAVSPSIQYNDFEYPPKIENFFKNTRNLKGFLFMSFADEGKGGAYRRLDNLYQNVSADLPENFTLVCRHYPDNNHITVLPSAMTEALNAYFENK
jgi:predicted alpha/beta superfamily hydrolase